MDGFRERNDVSRKLVFRWERTFSVGGPVAAVSVRKGDWVEPGGRRAQPRRVGSGSGIRPEECLHLLGDIVVGAQVAADFGTQAAEEFVSESAEVLVEKVFRDFEALRVAADCFRGRFGPEVGEDQGDMGVNAAGSEVCDRFLDGIADENFGEVPVEFGVDLRSVGSLGDFFTPLDPLGNLGLGTAFGLEEFAYGAGDVAAESASGAVDPFEGIPVDKLGKKLVGEFMGIVGHDIQPTDMGFDGREVSTAEGIQRSGRVWIVRVGDGRDLSPMRCGKSTALLRLALDIRGVHGPMRAGGGARSKRGYAKGSDVTFAITSSKSFPGSSPMLSAESYAEVTSTEPPDCRASRVAKVRSMLWRDCE